MKRVGGYAVGILFAVAIGVLLATGIRSGILFQFDQDEFAHAHVTYLLSHGSAPYKDFLMTYTPVFHTLLAPVFYFAGYSLKSMYLARWFMALLFLIRVIVSGWIAYKIFGKWIAAIFVLLFLANPFTIYTAMQIRPDNLMMLLFTIGCALYISKKYFWSGFLLAISTIVLLKIAPSILVIGAFVLFQKHARRLFFTGLFIPMLLFGTSISRGMVQQVIRDPYAINQSVAFPLPIYHFYELGKSALFDLYGNAWARLPIFELLFLLFGFVGIFFIKKHHPAQWILAGCLVAQGVSLFFVRSVFIQYFLPVTWLIDLFAAVTMVRLARFRILLVLFLLVFSLFIYDSVNANIARSGSTSNPQTTWLTAVWKDVPPNASVYPNIPFRPLVYPLMYGYYFHDLPPIVTRRLPPLVAALKKNPPEYILQTYEWKALPQDFFPYVFDNYHETVKGVFVRNK